MTIYLVSAALGVLIYTGQAVFGLGFAILALLSMFLAGVTFVYANPRLRTYIVVAAVVLMTSSAAIVIAARQPGETCIVSLAEARGLAVGAESARALSAGRALFEARGCVECHRPDRTGTGPTLSGLFGSPTEYPGSGAGVVDASYVREAILNPAATVAVGFSPIMPTFAGQLTEDELEALIVYVASLSERVQEQR